MDCSSFLPMDDQRALADAATEQAILGALLAKPALIADLPPSFSPEHYAFQDHADIHTAILALARPGVNAVQAVANAIAINDSEKRAYIGGLVGAFLGLSPAYLIQGCQVVTDLYQRRRLVDVAEAMRARAFAGSASITAERAVIDAMADLDSVSSLSPAQRPAVSIAEAADAALAAAERTARGEDTGIGTGFRCIDETIGGLEPGALYILAARPAMGKSALALQFALNMARRRIGVAYVSLEMQAAQLGRRALAVESGLPLQAVKAGKWTHEEAERLTQARMRMGAMPLTIEDQGGSNTAMIALKARAAKRRHGLGCLIIDHMHIVAHDKDAARMGATWAVSKISNDLKRIAKEMEIPVIALAQLNRGVEGRDDKRPSMHDLRQSGEIEQDAEAIMLLYRAEYYLTKGPPERMPSESDDKYDARLRAFDIKKQESAGKAELIMPKVRDGCPTTVELHFDGKRTAFEATTYE